MIAKGPAKHVSVNLEADTGANITVLKAGILEDMNWVNIEPTNMHIKGYSGIAEPCLGKAVVTFQHGNRSHQEEVFFSNQATSNFLSRDACMEFGIIPKGFPNVQVNTFSCNKFTLGDIKIVQILFFGLVSQSF